MKNAQTMRCRPDVTSPAPPPESPFPNSLSIGSKHFHFHPLPENGFSKQGGEEPGGLYWYALEERHTFWGIVSAVCCAEQSTYRIRTTMWGTDRTPLLVYANANH